MQPLMFSLGALLNPLITDVQSVIASIPLHLINCISLAFCFGQDELEWEVKGMMVMKCVCVKGIIRVVVPECCLFWC